MTKPTIYDYVAAANPAGTAALIHKYGYEVPETLRLNTALQQLIGLEGEPAFIDMMNKHPDKEVFIEFLNKSGDIAKNGTVMDYMNFTGTLAAAQQVGQNRKATADLSLMVLAGAVIVALAIVTRNT